MEFRTYSFRHAGVILNEPEYIVQYQELIEVLQNITDTDIITKHQNYGFVNEDNTPKSISRAINDLIKERYLINGWKSESEIFQDNQYQGETWRLDFAKNDISIEVAFNHSTVIAWNLIKPVLACELNHVKKAIQTKVGVIITATNELKQEGGFDGAIGTYEKFLDYLPPLQNLLTVPLLIIGLEKPRTFNIQHFQLAPRKKIGRVNLFE